MQKIKAASSNDKLNDYGLTVSLSLINDQEKKPYFDVIEDRRKEIELTREAVIEFDLDSVDYREYNRLEETLKKEM